MFPSVSDATRTRMPRFGWLFALPMSAVFANQSAAVLVLDQQLALSNSYAVEFDYNQQLRQRFTVDEAGLVSKFGLQLFRFDDGLDASSDVFIAIGSRFLPVTTYYGARVPVSEIPVINSFADPVPWTYVDVAEGKRLAQTGDQFSIVVSQGMDSLSADATTVYWRASGSQNSYSGGELARRIPPYSPSEFWAYFGDGDAGFETYVETAAIRRSASFTPAFDLQAEAPTGGPFSLTDGGPQIALQSLSPGDPQTLERRGLLEFDLASLPSDALITSAYLDLQVADFVPGSKSEGFSWISVAGYAGNGMPDAANAALVSPVLEQSTFSALGVKSLQLDVKKLEPMLAASDFLGLVTRALPSQFPSSFFTAESAANGDVLAPTLRLEFITTEPDSGDYNQDGLIDAADYVQWRKQGGTLIEYEKWQRDFGFPPPGSAASDGQVPEPGSALPLLLAIGLASLRIRHHGPN